MSSEGFHHRSSQKKVKTKHTSKSGKGKAKSKGKVEEKQRAHVKAAALEGAPRDIRVNRSKQLQKQKREDAIAKSRIGGNKGPAKIVALISLGPSVNLHHISTTLARHSGRDIRTPETSPYLHTITSTLHGRTRHIYCYETPRTTNAVLDIAKVADIVVFVMGADEKEEDGVGEDTFGKHCITILQAQGLPTIMGLVQAPLGMSDKKKHALRHTSQRYFDTAFGHGNVKMVYLDEYDDTAQQQTESATQVQQFFRWIHEIKLKPIHWREHRVYGMFEPISYTSTSDTMGTLCIRGQLRGSVALNVNQLIHLTGYGDYQIQQIDGVEEERILPTKQERRASRATLDIDMDGTSTVKPTINTKVNTLYTADSKQRESLDMLVPIDPLAHEQSIITEDDMPEEVKKSTQDVWDEVVERDDEEHSMYGDETKSNLGYDSKSMMGDDDDMDADLEMDPSLSSLRHRHDTMSTKEREDAEKEDAEFPDEVEFPIDTKCKIRLARYRGLKSFEKSPWDHNENLPLEYSEIYQFANFNATYKRIMKEIQLKQNEMDAGVAPNTGQQVIIHLINVPTAAAQQMREAKVPLILFGLYTYEHKVSVLHYQITRHGEYQQPIKSKDEMEIHCAFRRFVANPIYSKYKTDPSRALVKRWFHQSEQNTFYQASVYGQIMYPPANVLMFAMNATEAPAPAYPHGPVFRPIAASGSFLTVDPNRLLIKRIVLTGSVVSSHKRSAVVRHMFFNADDVRWFKPVELRTADGLVGHIREPRGTKGYMKCLFDQHIKQSDVVRMYLYKRQYPPRWKIQSFGIVGETK